MGRLKIVSMNKPKVLINDLNEAQYALEGSQGAKMKLYCDNYIQAADDYILYILPNAAEDIFSYIDWGEVSAKNRVEQGGIIVGRHFRDEKKNISYSLAERAVPAYGANGSMGFLDMRKEDWEQMHEDLDRMNVAKLEEKKYIILGWFHTHPNSLDVFMSGTDMYTQRNYFADDNCMALVFNPHRRIWKCFRKAECCDCKAELLIGKKLLAGRGKNNLYNRYVPR